MEGVQPLVRQRADRMRGALWFERGSGLGMQVLRVGGRPNCASIRVRRAESFHKNAGAIRSQEVEIGLVRRPSWARPTDHRPIVVRSSNILYY